MSTRRLSIGIAFLATALAAFGYFMPTFGRSILVIAIVSLYTGSTLAIPAIGVILAITTGVAVYRWLKAERSKPHDGKHPPDWRALRQSIRTTLVPVRRHAWWGLLLVYTLAWTWWARATQWPPDNEDPIAVICTIAACLGWAVLTLAGLIALAARLYRRRRQTV